MTVPTPPATGHRVIVVDNYDSFTFSLARLFSLAGARVEVIREDRLPPLVPGGQDLIVLSPGPGRPEEHPVNLELLARLPSPIFGVCLGLQAFALSVGARVLRGRPVHGRRSAVHHGGKGCFEGLPSPFPATRYNSLLVERATLPDDVEVTADTRRGEVMGLRHRRLPIEAVQFHPESVRTRFGLQLVQNVLASITPSGEADLRSRG